ncbi:hypothetical protein HU200_004920 [Digitaria exilis]|uniref:Uncharacterized protein n=1 Tax=Digitaria exilis TaxID=1010633 RepID=A0A835FS59_9POAL|nr:hypothetical protein HU200_004920 [Digitaria exilis]
MDPPYAINARTPICLPGFFYWSALHSITGHGPIKVSSDVILRFSLHDETFTVHPYPPCRGFLSNSNSLRAWWQDMLCTLFLAMGCGHLVGRGWTNLAWSQRCCVRLPIPRLLHVFACASTDRDKIFLSVDAWYLLKCDMRNESLEVIGDMARDMLYDHGNGTKFCTGKLPAAHYMVPSVESLLRIRP